MKKPIERSRLLRSLFFPHPAVVAVCVPAAAALLAATFLVWGENHPIAYLVYPFSAYALVVLCTGVVPLGRAAFARVQRIPLVGRLLRDLPFRARAALYASLGVNLVYAGMNAASGLRQRSVWFVTLAVYYLFLAVMRFSLVRCTRRAGADLPGEYRRYRFCGVLLVLMNAALAGVVVLVLHRGGGFRYSGFMIYAMAAYAFYATIAGVVNLVRYRRYNSPVLTASRALSLAAALVSMLSLEVAMLAAFSTEEQAAFSTGMIAGSGFGVCAVVAGLGTAMWVQANRALRRSPATTPRR